MLTISLKRIDISSNKVYNNVVEYHGINVHYFGGIVVDGYMTTKEAAKKWEISQRQVQIHCQKKRIPGVFKVGTNYLIPLDATRPIYGFYSALNGETEKNE